MRTWIAALTLFITILHMAFTAPAWAGPCAENAYGLSSLRGDAQYPPGWAGGPIKISAPDELVYGIIDGSVEPQQFGHIKAKVQNLLVDYPMGAGTVTAVARYRKRTDYQPDLSADPPGEQSVEEEFTSSASALITVSELPSDAPVAFTFDFSAQPIPAGITDLYLLVIFEGQIGDLQDSAVAIGIKDLNEPMHFTPWNYRDWFLLDYQLRPAQDVNDDPNALDFIVDQNCLGISFNCIAPVSENYYAGFTKNEEDEPVYVAYYQDLAPGYHGRFITLLGEESYFVHTSRERSSGCSYNEIFVFPFGSVVNQISSSGFKNTATTSWRGIKTHNGTLSIYACPAPDKLAVYSDMLASKQPASVDPVPATAITFP